MSKVAKATLENMHSGTKSGYDYARRLFIEFQGSQMISIDLIESFFLELSKKYKPSSLWSIFSHLKKIFFD